MEVLEEVIVDWTLSICYLVDDKAVSRKLLTTEE